MASYQPIQGAALASVSAYGGFITAEGQWKSLDPAEPLTPDVVKIECRQEEKRCILADVSLPKSASYVSPPYIEQYDATFSGDGVTFDNSDPVCVTISYRIDLKLKKVFAIRTKKPNIPAYAVNECKGLVDRIEMTLANSYDTLQAPRDGHFLPFFAVLEFVLRSRK